MFLAFAKMNFPKFIALDTESVLTYNEPVRLHLIYLLVGLSGMGGWMRIAGERAMGLPISWKTTSSMLVVRCFGIRRQY